LRRDGRPAAGSHVVLVRLFLEVFLVVEVSRGRRR
jgi:hypothetical protein